MFYPRSIASASLSILGFLYGFCFDCIHKFTLLFEDNSNNRIPHIENAFHPSRSWRDLETAYKSSQAEIFDWLVFHGCTGCSRAALKRPGFALSLPAPDMTVAWQDSFGSTAWLQAVLRLHYLTMDGVNIRHHWKPHSCFINVAEHVPERTINTFHIALPVLFKVLWCLLFTVALLLTWQSYTRPFKLQPLAIHMPYLVLGYS